MPPKGKLTFTTDPISMSQQVEFIQENIPEVLDIKRKSLKSIAEVTNKEIIISVTGRDCFFFEKAFKNSIFANPFLVMKGLNEILDYNE